MKLILQIVRSLIAPRKPEPDRYQEWLESAYPETLTAEQVAELHAARWD